MFFVKLIILYALIYGTLFLSGWGICEYLCNGKNQKYKFLLAPIIGLMSLSSIPMYLSFLGVKTSISGWITFIFFASISLYCLVKNPPSLKKEFHFYLLLLVVIIGAIPSFAVIWKAGYLTTTLQAYSTPKVYLSEYYSLNSALEKVSVDFDNPITNMLKEISGITPFTGYLFYLATISSIFNILPYKLYLILSGISGSLISISVYITCKEGFKLGKWTALFIAFLISINITYFFWPIIGHLSFVTGKVYLILAFGFIPEMLTCSKKKDYIFHSLIIAGIMSMYFLLIPYVIGTVIFYILWNIRIPRNCLTFIKNIGKISLIAFLITPFVFIFLGLRSLEFTSNTSKFTTNIPRHAYIEELFGFGQHFSMLHNSSLKYYLTSFIVFILILCVFTGLYERFKNRNVIFLSILSFIVSLGGYFYATGLTYHFYKNSITAVFIIITALVIGGDVIYRKTGSRIIKLSIGGVFVVFVGLNINTYFKIGLRSSHPIVTSSLADLGGISKIVTGDERIVVNSNNPTEEVWISYFLKNNNIKLKGSIEPWGFWIYSPFSGKPDFNYFYNYKKDRINYTLSPKHGYKTDIVSTDYGEIVYENAGFILSKNIPNPFLLKGWYDIEKDNDGIYRWTKKESSVLFRKPDKDSILYIKGIIPKAYKKPIEIKINLNSNLIDKFSLKESDIFTKQYLLSKFSLKNYNNELSITLSDTFVPNEMGYSIDLRKLGIKIKTIAILDLTANSRS